MKRIAVIGAGIAGLTAARALGDEHTVVVFEKSRGVGGRMATRYAGRFEFDHGAQFFTAQSRAFRQFLHPMIAAGVVTPWQARFAEIHGSRITARRQWDAAYPHYVGAPRMNEVGRWLARDIDIRLHTRVEKLVRSGERWTLVCKDGSDAGNFDWVIIAVPGPQAATLAPTGSSLEAHATRAEMKSCFALMLAFDAVQKLSFDAARVLDADISWLSANHSKPGRTAAFCLVAHSTNAWADRHIDSCRDDVIAHLRAECERIAGVETGSATHCDLQRWRYANIDRQPGPHFFIDRNAQLAACGDWFVRGRVEGAFSSASALVKALRHYSTV